MPEAQLCLEQVLEALRSGPEAAARGVLGTPYRLCPDQSDTMSRRLILSRSRVRVSMDVIHVLLAWVLGTMGSQCLPPRRGESHEGPRPQVSS